MLYYSSQFDIANLGGERPMFSLDMVRRLAGAVLALFSLLIVGGVAACGGDANSPDGPATGGTGLSIPVTVVKAEMANRCGTAYGACYMNGAIAKGLSCYCPTPYGAVPGTAF